MHSLGIDKLVDIGECLTSQLADMDMKSWIFTANDHEVASARLTKFFNGIIEALKTYHEDRSTSFANESRKFARSVLYAVLLNLARHNPELDLSKIFKRLSENTVVTVADKIEAPSADKVLRVPRIQGDCRD